MRNSTTTRTSSTATALRINLNIDGFRASLLDLPDDTLVTVDGEVLVSDDAITCEILYFTIDDAAAAAAAVCNAFCAATPLPNSITLNLLSTILSMSEPADQPVKGVRIHVHH